MKTFLHGNIAFFCILAQKFYSMNWQQLYTSATHEERLEVLTLMLQTIEARQHKWVLAKGRLLFERRRLQTAHFIGERRNRQTYRRIYLNTFLFVITTLTIGVWVTILRVPPQYGAPLLFLHLTSLTAILLIKPYRHRTLHPS